MATINTNPYYVFHEEMGDRYWDGSISHNIRFGKADLTWYPIFSREPRKHYMLDKVEESWSYYEMARRYHHPELPKLTVRKLQPQIIVHDHGKARMQLAKSFIFTQRLRAKHGEVITDAARKVLLTRKVLPVYAIKRKGKTQQLVRDVLPDSIAHEGMFMFFWDEEDIIMAKVALGSNIAYSYDLRAFHPC